MSTTGNNSNRMDPPLGSAVPPAAAAATEAAPVAADGWFARQAKRLGAIYGKAEAVEAQAKQASRERVSAAAAGVGSALGGAKAATGGIVNDFRTSYNEASGRTAATAAAAETQNVIDAAKTSAFKQGAADVKSAGRPIVDAIKSVGGKIKDVTVGGGGSVATVTGKAMSLGASIVKGSANVVARNPGVALLAAAGAGVYAIVGISKRKAAARDAENQQALEVETVKNAALKAQVAAMPEFNNDVSGGFADKYGTRSQSAPAR